MTQEHDPKTRMHTAEHILNQTMVRMFDCGRCFSAHIEKKKSKCDYHLARAPTVQEINAVEERVNEIIRADIPITEEYISREEATTRFTLKRLPDEVGDELRIVRVGDYDAIPCISLHVDSSKDIGQFRIISWSFDNGVLRIRYKLSTTT